MTTTRKVLVCVSVLSILSGPSAFADTFVHTVRPGETVSLICIMYYGLYNAQMGEAVQALNPDMKNINVIRAGQALSLRNPSAPQTGSAEKTVLERTVAATQGVVTYVCGKAFLAQGKTKTALGANTVVKPGDALQTGADGRVEVIINRESVVRMGPNSRLVISALRSNADKKGTTSVKFELGTVWAKIRKFSDSVQRFQLELPTAVAGVHGTVYQTRVNSDSSAEVNVYEGEVSVTGERKVSGPSGAGASEVEGPHEIEGPQEVTMEEWVRIVRSMQRIRIDRSGAASQPQPFTKQSGEWEAWNDERDSLISNIFSRELE